MLVRTLAAAALIATAAAAQAEEVTISHGYSNFGELKYGPDEPLAYVNLDAPKGGEISFSTLATFDSFNPYTRKGVAERTGPDLMYETLMISTLDDPYGSYCYLCTTLEYPEDLSWVVVNLRDDVTFSDGTPMTAEDIKFSVDILLEQAIVEFRNVVGGFIRSVEVTGPHQIRFEFNDTTPKRDRMGMVGLWPAWSKAWFEENEARIDDSSEVPFLGTGPYVLDEVEMGRTVAYIRDPNWWGADLPINQGRNNFDRVRVEAFLDQTAALEAFKAGEYTYRSPGSAKEWATDYDIPAVERGWIITETLPDQNIDAARGLAFNLRREPWQDPRIRDAVRMMFNFEWSNETLFYGFYERPTSFWGGTDLAADGTPTEGEMALLQPLVDEGLLNPSILTDEAVLPPTNNAERNAVDRRTRRAATRLMEEAGYTVGDDGMLRNAAGETLELTIIQFDANLDRIMNPFIENLRSIGIDARLRRTDTSQYVELRRAGEWDLSNIVPGQGFEPGTGLKQWFGSETAENSSRNIMALAEPGIDRLIDNVVAAETLDDLQTGIRALDRALRAHGFWLAQWENNEIWAAYWNQYRHPETLPPLGIGVLDFWWYDEDAATELREAGAL